MDPGEQQAQRSNSADRMDDIAEAAFDLQEVIDSIRHTVSRESQALSNVQYIGV